MGRGKEWEQLLACWRRAAQGDTCMALVLGEPGIGKSRLADELYHWRSQKKDGAAARARCYIAQGQLAYAPAAEWLRSDALRQARTRLSKPQLAELARVLPEILCGNPDLPPPQPLTESWQRRHFYEALNALFHNAPKPLLLLIDDLQWCDRDSFEWLHSLFQSVSAGHILILGTARPEETGRDHPLTRLAMELKRDGRVAEIPLEPLNSEDTAALAIRGWAAGVRSSLSLRSLSGDERKPAVRGGECASRAGGPEIRPRGATPRACSDRSAPGATLGSCV